MIERLLESITANYLIQLQRHLWNTCLTDSIPNLIVLPSLA